MIVCTLKLQQLMLLPSTQLMSFPFALSWLMSFTPTLSTVTNAKKCSFTKKKSVIHSSTSVPHLHLVLVVLSSAARYNKLQTGAVGTQECWATYDEFVYQAAPRIEDRNVQSKERERRKVEVWKQSQWYEWRPHPPVHTQLYKGFYIWRLVTVIIRIKTRHHYSQVLVRSWIKP